MFNVLLRLTLRSFIDYATIVYGSLTVQMVDPGSMDFKMACDALKYMQPSQWTEFVANARLAKFRKSETDLQRVVNCISPLITDWLQSSWKAGASVHMMNPSDTTYVRFNDLPGDVMSSVGARWDPVRKRFDETTMHNFMTSNLSLHSSLGIGGPPGINKTSLLHTLCREFCAQTGKVQYGMSSDLDVFGMLSQKGITHRLGAVSFDDCSLTTGNGRPLNANEIKQLLEVRFASSWSCRYHPATFLAMTPKCFAFQYEGINRPRCEGFDADLPWIRYVASRDVEAMTALNKDLQAQARRATIFIFEGSILGKMGLAKFSQNDNDELENRKKRRVEFQSSHGF